MSDLAAFRDRGSKHLRELAEQHLQHDLNQSDRDTLKSAAGKVSSYASIGSLLGVGLGVYCAFRLRSMRLAYFNAFRAMERPVEVRFADGRTRVSIPSTITPSTYASTTSSATLSGTTGSSNSTARTTELSQITGGTRTSNATATGTTSTARPTNTQPCNNFAEFCSRKYSNITEVCAHNSPFARQRNVQSNQQYGVTQQLNDGIRILQGQAHYVNDTLYYCHTSCDLINTGTVESYLAEVVAWLQKNPFEVLTIIFGNFDYQKQGTDGKPLVTSQNFVDPIEKSGLKQYIYQPPATAMGLDDWPTLGELILGGKRVITFIDYNFDTDAVPWMLWEFYNVWETPFSPTDATFPCTIGRPDGIADDQARNMLYMANHNLNVAASIAGIDLLIPNTAALQLTNGVEGNGSLGQMSNTCAQQWGRPPNFLLVDYYNYGVPNGTVFEVAARANNVTYDRKCCGTASQGTISVKPTTTWFALAIAVGAAIVI
ncbi:PLC-like phosphodiesterase [Massarina eburnea CBS 473.64]|uniref:PLC-like phosphodiesterase n=1 Tax=Massarina eburnea CBS 473.64 TaxID=1395130 RepID=A0A6A6S519_9PLEO|nr:PLC-like phosphodiesterase [Massarina eburnea CBS 473.64]